MALEWADVWGAPTLQWFTDPVDDSGDGELADAVVVALGTDRRADSSDILPGLDDDDRRGWWGDLDAETVRDGWPIGTRFWLLSRAKITGPEASEGATIGRARAYAHESMQPYIDRGIASAMDITAERTAIDQISVGIKLFRGPLQEVDLQYAILWNRIQR